MNDDWNQMFKDAVYNQFLPLILRFLIPAAIATVIGSTLKLIILKLPVSITVQEILKWIVNVLYIAALYLSLMSMIHAY